MEQQDSAQALSCTHPLVQSPVRDSRPSKECMHTHTHTYAQTYMHTCMLIHASIEAAEPSHLSYTFQTTPVRDSKPSFEECRPGRRWKRPKICVSMDSFAGTALPYRLVSICVWAVRACVCMSDCVRMNKVVDECVRMFERVTRCTLVLQTQVDGRHSCVCVRTEEKKSAYLSVDVQACVCSLNTDTCV